MEGYDVGFLKCVVVVSDRRKLAAMKNKGQFYQVDPLRVIVMAIVRVQGPERAIH